MSRWDALGVALVVGPIWLVGAWVHAKIWPTRVCTHCDGRGETGPEGSRVRRVCGWCKGTGRTRRWLARL